MIDVLYGKELFNHTVVTSEVTATDTSSQTSSNSGDGANLLQGSDETSTDTTATEGETTTEGDTNTQGEVSSEEGATTEENTTTEGETTDGQTGTENSGDTAVDTGEMQPDIIDDSGNSEVTGDMSGDMSGMEGMEGMGGDGTTSTTVKDPFLSSYVPVIGITAVTLFIGAAIGVLLAKKKIKKGIDLYED